MSMSPSDPLPPSKPKPSSVPMALPGRRRPLIPAVQVAEGDEEVETTSPWEWHGWAWSLLVHSLLLLALGLWVFSTPTSQVRTFDTRLAGSDLGSEAGLTELGGLDTPIVLPDLVPPPTATTTLERIRPIDMAPQPTAGITVNVTNPGAGLGDGFGLAKFGSGGENVRGVEVKVGDPQFTLLWDSPADLDIHVIEPSGKEIYWNDPRGLQGGELDVDNTEGFGPENIYWLKQAADGSKDLGPGPPGVYKWQVVYYGGNRGFPVASRWRVRIKHAGKVDVIQGRLTVPKSRSKVYELKVGDPTQGSSDAIIPPVGR